MPEDEKMAEARKEKLGVAEIARREEYYHLAQALCYALVTNPDRRTHPIANEILEEAELLREKIIDYIWRYDPPTRAPS